MKILIVDGEMSRQRNLRSILTSIGYKSADVESLSDADAALNAMKKRKFDCLFISDELPKNSQTGLELTQNIRGNSRWSDFPIILYMSEISKENIMEAVNAGASSVLGHPFSVSDVESALQQAFRGKKKQLSEMMD